MATVTSMDWTDVRYVDLRTLPNQFLGFGVTDDGTAFWAECWVGDAEDGTPVVVSAAHYTEGLETWRVTHVRLGPEAPTK